MRPLRRIVEDDLKTGAHDTFDHVVESLRSRSGADERILELTESPVAQVDIGVGTDRVHRLHVQRQENGGSESRYFSLWEVNNRGWPQNEMHTYMNYPTDSGCRTVIRGSSRGSIDGMNVGITPREFSERVDGVLGNLNEYNWRVVEGREYVPQGEV